jgi:hypothetical protein
MSEGSSAIITPVVEPNRLYKNLPEPKSTEESKGKIAKGVGLVLLGIPLLPVPALAAVSMSEGINMIEHGKKELKERKSGNVELAEGEYLDMEVRWHNRIDHHVRLDGDNETVYYRLKMTDEERQRLSSPTQTPPELSPRSSDKGRRHSTSSKNARTKGVPKEPEDVNLQQRPRLSVDANFPRSPRNKQQHTSRSPRSKDSHSNPSTPRSGTPALGSPHDSRQSSPRDSSTPRHSNSTADHSIKALNDAATLRIESPQNPMNINHTRSPAKEHHHKSRALYQENGIAPIVALEDV